MACEKYNVKVPWYIMTSRENNEATVKFFEENRYFNYGKENVIFFTQAELPMVNENGKILIDEEYNIKKAANGHGGIFNSMEDNKIIEDMKNKNIKWVFIGGVDNILAKMVDSLLLGLAIENKVLLAGKSVAKKAPSEKVGVFCKKNGKPSVVEYSEISREMSEKTNIDGELKFGESHILCNLFNIEFIEKIAQDKLPYHTAYKKANYIGEDEKLVIAEKPNAYKFEAFLFDAFEKIDNMIVMRVKREDEFAPVKNSSGEDSPQSARELYLNFHKNN